jgi:hypothetical protein
MGSWGTAISSNDSYADIYDEFFELYNNGIEVSEVSERLLKNNQEIIKDPDDANNFWFAIAKAQWECKQLDPKVLDKVRQIIESGNDIEVWKRLDATDADLKKRKAVLDKFLTDIQSERPKAKARRKKVIRQPVFSKGDCLTFSLKNGNYGGAVVLEAEYDTEYGYNLIATTRINSKTKPTIRDFENSEVLVRNFTSWEDKPTIDWYYPIRYKETAYLFEKVGQLDVQIKYDKNHHKFGSMADLDIWIINQVNDQFESEKTQPAPKVKQTIKGLTRKKIFGLF